MKQEQEVPVGFAGAVQKDLEIMDPRLFDGCEKSDYCGFEIKYLGKEYFFGQDEGFVIRKKANFYLTMRSMIAIRRGICDTKEYAKYFVDQLLYMDEDFIHMCEQLKQQKEFSDKKAIVSMYLKNI